MDILGQYTDNISQTEREWILGLNEVEKLSGFVHGYFSMLSTTNLREVLSRMSMFRWLAPIIHISNFVVLVRDFLVSGSFRARHNLPHNLSSFF